MVFGSVSKVFFEFAKVFIPHTKLLAAEGFSLVFYRIGFVHQDFLSPQGYLSQLPIACISGSPVAAWVPRVPKGT